MNNFENIMILNNKNIGISRIELNKSALYIVDKANKYSLCVHIYNKKFWIVRIKGDNILCWRKIRNLECLQLKRLKQW